MKFLYSLTLSILLLIVFPFASQAQDVDPNSKHVSLKVNDASWQPNMTRGEYLFDKNQSAERVSISMFKVEGTKIANVTFKIVRFEGNGEYKVGERFNLIGAYNERSGAEAGPTYSIVEESGMVEITAYDAKALTISGKFSFQLKDKNSDNVIRVTNGKFKGIQLIDVTPEDK
jgi:hypothetical protein